MEKKYQIFISSTYKDLIEARSKVRDAILSMMHFPVGMEMFNAADEEQWEIIQETIDSSDYYVLILGQRYGSVIESGSDAGISYTEKEFRYAREKKIPVLVFIIDDDVAIKPEFIEKDPESIKKLADFKTEAKKGRTVQWWTNIDELAREVSESLHQQMDRKKRPGWIRGDAFDIEASHAEILSLNLFNCNNNDYNYNGHQYDYEPTLYGTLFKVKVVHFLPDAIDQYYWLSYYDSFIQFCGEGNCTFDLGWIDRNSLHFIDFWPWNLLHLRVF